MAKKKTAAPKMSAPMMAVQAANYSKAIWWTIIVRIAEARFPGVGRWLEAAAEQIPFEKLYEAYNAAVADWSEGKDIFTILQELLKEWVEIDPAPGVIRMTAKPPAEPAA